MSGEVSDDAVLSDVDDDEDPAPIVLSGNPPAAPAAPDEPSAADQRVRDLLAEIDNERRLRRAAEESKSELQINLTRLRAIAQDVIRKRDEALREKDEAVRSSAELSDALRLKDEALKREELENAKQRESLRAEMEAASRMLVTGIEKISGKVSNFKNFSAGGLPRSQKYTGMQAVSYGVIKRANEIAEELVKHVETATQAKDQAREQIEQRNYEIAIEVSEMEATIGTLREESAKKGSEILSLERSIADRDAKISAMDVELTELRQFCEESSGKLRSLEARLDAQRPLVIDQLNYISKAYQEINEIIRVADESKSDSSESLFMWEEMDLDKNMQTSLEGTISVYELAKVANEKVRERVEERIREAKVLHEKVADLLTEKQYIGTLLRGALSSKANEVFQVAENGLKEAGIDLRYVGYDKNGKREGEEDEVYTLAGALENTVKESQLKIIELKHLVETLRAEAGLLKARLDAHAKEIVLKTNQINELEEKERIANESVEGLMMDIAAAEEEIARWKAAAEQEAAAGRAIEQELLSQLSGLQQELSEAKQAMVELEKKLKMKEETATAAMAARAAAETSLRLADQRSSRLRDRLEELTRQLEESDNTSSSIRSNSHRYACWPWQWLGLNSSVPYQSSVQESSNEMELSEPLI